MTRLRIGKATVVVGILGLVLAGCQGNGAEPEATDTAPTGPTEGTTATDTETGAAEPSGEPIVVGSTLSLTGAFGPTGVIHQVAGEQFVDDLNASGGLLGRPVEWTVLDDESDSARVSALYERLITEDEVDLILGPYATPNIAAAMSVAERNGYTMPYHTGVLTYALTYECAFPSWSVGTNPPQDVPNMVFDLLEAQGDPPATVAFVSNQAGSTDFIPHGEPNTDQGGAVQVAEDRGYEVVLDLPYPPANSDWGPVASQVRDADPDFLFISGVALDSTNLIQAMEQLNYDPPQMFDLFPAPGPLLGAGDQAEGMLAVSLFEPNPPVLEGLDPEVTQITEDFSAAAADRDLPYTVFETQAAASWTAWEFLVSGVEDAGSLDQQAICENLQSNGVDTTLFGQIDFDPEANNFYENKGGVKQIQDGDWWIVWPEDVAASEFEPAS